jgi:multiple sugar transport system substrate-binding protein
MGLLSRRSVLGTGLGLLAAPALAGAGAAQQRTRLRLTFWGNTERARRTQAALDAYQRKNPGIEVATESIGWTDYWTRLATQVAGGNAPDLIQMDYRYIFEYARRRALKPLDEFMPDPLNIRDFGQANIDTGKVDGQVFGVSMGVNSTAMFFDKAAFERHRIPPLDQTTTWAQFAERVTELARKENRRGYFGSANAGFVEPLLEVWVRQRGKLLYNEEGRFGFARDDLAEFWDYWDRLKRAGGAVPGELQALYRSTPETDMIATNHAAVAFQHSNQLVAWQSVIRSPLGITMFPQGERPGQYYKPSMLISLAATTQQGREAARLVNFLSTDPEAATALGAERGVPASGAMRNQLLPNADELTKAMIEYIALISDRISPLPPPPPRGAGEIEQLLRRIYETVSVGAARVPEAADRFMTEAQRTLERA